ncbi:hypothetical protein MMC14_000571 [Varicellaria rhodocarpa]|nr:hypothetical protein [Varicellaria rhodocarpa]
MECAICHRPANTRLPFNCITCARNVVYESRLLHAQVLLQKEDLGKDIERAVAAVPSTNTGRSPQKGSKSNSGSLPNGILLERLDDERLTATERTRECFNQIQTLHEEIKCFKVDIAKRRKSLAERKAALESAKKNLARRQATDLEPIQTSIDTIESRWQALHTMAVEARVFLCKEVANLYGLQHRKQRKDEVGRDSYIIGGNPIIDLRDINSMYTAQHPSSQGKGVITLTFTDADPAHITVTITHLAHLVHLISHYLSLRLPAEISLPNAKHPYSTISSPLSSYTKPSLPTPILAKSSSSSSHPTATTIRSQPHPRPLHLEKPLQALAKEDPVAYSLFVDGISLLAWDIAWVCKSQGLDIGAKSWEDVCAIGKNMWLLLISPPSYIRPAPPSRTTSAKISNNTSKLTPPINQPQHPQPSLPSALPADLVPSPSPTITLAHFTHNSSNHFFAGAEGAEYLSGWKLANPIRVIEKVKAALASERMGAEWEYLEDGEWNEGDGGEDGRGTGGVGEGAKGKGIAAATGTSGWTKLKRRDGD